jgi:hypothetical protein
MPNFSLGARMNRAVRTELNHVLLEAGKTKLH